MKKKPRDINQLAKFIVGSARMRTIPKNQKSHKNPAVIELGRLGSLKGGKSKKEKLTPEQRSEIAKKTPQSRRKK